VGHPPDRATERRFAALISSENGSNREKWDQAYNVGPYDRYKWSYSPYKWPYKWVTGVITPTNGVIILLLYVYLVGSYLVETLRLIANPAIFLQVYDVLVLQALLGILWGIFWRIIPISK